MRRRPTPATAIAVVALFIALGGTAVAAGRYIITSTSQIKPSVLRDLRGHDGATGQAGTAGQAGAQGAPGSATSGEKGATGNEGAVGKEGPQGLPGTPGTTIVTMVRSAGAVMTTTEETEGTADPLTSATWTQGAEELNELVGQIVIAAPSEATCSMGSGNHVVIGSELFVRILMNGNLVGQVGTSTTSMAMTKTLPIDVWSYEPGKNTSQTLEAKVSDTCGREGGNTGGHFKIESIGIDAVGIR